MAANVTETIDQSAFSRQLQADGSSPGLVLVFSAGEPMQGALPMGEAPILIGRGALEGVDLRDGCMSRRHAEISWEKGVWTVKDFGSRNGTSVNGESVTGAVTGAQLRVVRTGESIFLLCNDVRPFMGHPVEIREECVVGPSMRPAFDHIQRAAATGILHITGETGTGKEIAARTFHRCSVTPNGPFIAVNCAAVPASLAEGLFFGARKGAYSGATSDQSGYLADAHGGTLFLDEIGELSLDLQAKLLRVLETREVLALGASRPRKVDIRICSATHHDLRAAVAAGKFREDLFYRIGRPHVALPPLRARPEDIPLLIDRELRKVSPKLVAHVSLIQACVLRPWPGNVRELLVEVREAGAAALHGGQQSVRASALSAEAGMAHPAGDTRPSDGDAEDARPFPSAETIEETLRRTQGKVATAARALGLHRTQLRRWLEKNGVDPSRYAAEGDENSTARD